MHQDHSFSNISWRTNLWLTPTLTVAAALAIFALSERLDWANHTGKLIFPFWLDQGSASDARSLLSATTGAIITTLGLVLSITVLTLSIAASQFGQRLLRRYMRDRGTQVCIGIFAATFVFSLLTLLSVTSRPHESEYVPWLSIWISTVGALTCIIVLIYYINHVANSIQVNNVLADLSNDFRWAIHNLKPADKQLSLPVLSPNLCIQAVATGYIQSIDYVALTKTVSECGAVTRFLFRPGEFIVKGATLAVAETPEPQGQRLRGAFAQAVRIGLRRTLRQDPEFAIAQILEIALRAMSPAINDPNTAVACVHWLSDALRIQAKTPQNSGHADHRGVVRVMEKVQDLEQAVASAYDPIRYVARNSPTLSIAILNSIGLIAPFVYAPNGRTALRNQLRLVNEGLSPEATSWDREQVTAAYIRALERIPTSGQELLIGSLENGSSYVNRERDPATAPDS